jgi:hypothetical protein
MLASTGRRMNLSANCIGARPVGLNGPLLSTSFGEVRNRQLGLRSSASGLRRRSQGGSQTAAVRGGYIKRDT